MLLRLRVVETLVEEKVENSRIVEKSSKGNKVNQQ